MLVVNRSGVDAVGPFQQIVAAAVAHGRKPAYRGPMIVERRKGERSVVLVYCLTERDRSVAEYLGPKLPAYLIRYAGPGCGRGSGS